MVKKKESIDRVLMTIVSLLLAALVSMVGFGGRQVISNQKETVKAVNELRVVLTSHSERIGNAEEKLKDHKTKIDKNTENIYDLDKRVDRLEH